MRRRSVAYFFHIYSLCILIGNLVSHCFHSTPLWHILVNLCESRAVRCTPLFKPLQHKTHVRGADWSAREAHLTPSVTVSSIFFSLDRLRFKAMRESVQTSQNITNLSIHFSIIDKASLHVLVLKNCTQNIGPIVIEIKFCGNLFSREIWISLTPITFKIIVFFHKRFYFPPENWKCQKNPFWCIKQAFLGNNLITNFPPLYSSSIFSFRSLHQRPRTFTLLSLLWINCKFERNLLWVTCHLHLKLLSRGLTDTYPPMGGGCLGL